MRITTPLQGACKEYEEDLVLHYYGETAADEHARVERHLTECDPCRRFLADLRGLLPQITRTEELPRSFWDGYYRETMAKLAEYDEKKSWWRSWLAPVSGWMMPAFGTVTAAVLVVGLIYGKDNLRLFVEPKMERIPQEIIADENQLEFFKSLDMLEALSNLEAQDEANGDATRSETGRGAAVTQSA